MSFFNELEVLIRKPENHIPNGFQRNDLFQEDSWSKAGVNLKITDDGRTKIIKSNNVHVIQGFNGEKYEKFLKGSNADLLSLIEKLKNNFS